MQFTGVNGAVLDVNISENGNAVQEISGFFSFPFDKELKGHWTDPLWNSDTHSDAFTPSFTQDFVVVSVAAGSRLVRTLGNSRLFAQGENRGGLDFQLDHKQNLYLVFHRSVGIDTGDDSVAIAFDYSFPMAIGIKDYVGKISAEAIFHRLSCSVIADSGSSSGLANLNREEEGFFAISTAPLVYGKLSVADYTGNLRRLPLRLQLVDSNGSIVQAVNTQILSNEGGFVFTTDRVGTYRLIGKLSHWLAVDLGNVQLSGSQNVAGIVGVSINGDIDQDNSVSIFDYAILSDYFDHSQADSSWGLVGPNGFRPSDADLDGDGANTIFDYAILSKNFDQVGASF
ncbi:MAG: hypothetical protein JST40_12710 [Armatimonadetes bacterium]|nr:hypothetical protein [Armatimonadota bacterium]